MAHLIDKSALVAEIERRIKEIEEIGTYLSPKGVLTNLLCHLDTLEVIDPYEQWVQYPSREIGIKAHAEDYSWNIESELFQQLTPEQQKLWRKEIEQACISGGYSGLNLANDPRYEENLEVKEVDLDGERRKYLTEHFNVYEDGILQSKRSNLPLDTYDVIKIAEHFFELGMAQHQNIWHPMSEIIDHPCTILMHGYGNDVWICDAVDKLQPSTAQEWAYIDDVLLLLGLKAQKGEKYDCK